MQDAIIVVPCFNEEKRLPVAPFLSLTKAARLLFVDDGSRDGTAQVLASLVAQGKGRVEYMALAQNLGKAEAVRQGMVRAAKSGADFVGFADSDLATPVEELERLLATAGESAAQVVLGSRVGLAGMQVERKLARHYAGRIFATAASVVLHARFYDTQCGAKIFKNTPLLRSALSTPFRSRWIFDVELLGRMLAGTLEEAGIPENAFLEVPLRRWVDVAGSKLRLSSWLRAAVDLGLISADLSQRRRRRR